jgi:hypothetical protein
MCNVFIEKNGEAVTYMSCVEEANNCSATIKKE